MAINPQYTNVPKVGIGKITSATTNVNLDGSGTLIDIFEAGSNGGRIEEVLVKALGNTGAEIVRLYIDDGTTAYLITEIAIIETSSVITFESGIKLEIVMPPNYKLKASSPSLQSTVNVIAIGGDF